MGFAFALMTSLLFAGSNVYMRKAAKAVDGRSAMTTILAVHAALLVPLAVVVIGIGASPPPAMSAVVAFAAVGIVGGWLGRWGLYVAIRDLGAGRASAVKNTSPVFALPIGIVLLNEWPTLLPLMGIVAILVGVWLLSQDPVLVRMPRPTGERALAGVFEEGTVMAPPAVRTVGSVNTGLMVAVGAAFLFALADSIRSLGMDTHPNALVGAAVASASAPLGAFALNAVLRRRRRDGAPFWPRPTAPVVVVAGITAVAQITNFLAVRFMAVAYVSALLALTPLFTAVLDGFLSRGVERYDRHFYGSTLLLVFGAGLIGLYS